MAGSCGCGGDGDSGASEIITYPPFQQISTNQNSRSFSQIAGIVPWTDTIEIDFTDGTVARPSMENAKTSQSLASMDAEWIRSIDVYADAPVQVHIPDERDQTKAGFYNQDVRDVQLRNIRTKTLEVSAREPTMVVVIASPTPDLAMDTFGVPLSKVRVGLADRNADSDLVSYQPGPDFGTIRWAPPTVPAEEETLPFTGPAAQDTQRNWVQTVGIPPNSNASLHAENDGNVDVGVAAEVRVTRFPWNFVDVGPSDWAPLPGWEEDAPKVVSADSARILSLNEALEGPGTGFTHARISAGALEDTSTFSEGRMALVVDYE